MTATSPHPPYGGTLDFNGYGIAGCVRCGWRGVPTRTGGERVGPGRRPFPRWALGYRKEGSARSVVCPSCGTAEERGDVVKVGRNAPCPCGSGKKSKKCCGA